MIEIYNCVKLRVPTRKSLRVGDCLCAWHRLTGYAIQSLVAPRPRVAPAVFGRLERLAIHAVLLRPSGVSLACCHGLKGTSFGTSFGTLFGTLLGASFALGEHDC